MSSTQRRPGEHPTDWQRRVIKTERPDLDPDRIVGPPTNAPRTPHETVTDWKERLADLGRSYAAQSAKTDDDPDDGDR